MSGNCTDLEGRPLFSSKNEFWMPSDIKCLVLKGFQVYILQGKPIQKNQFGTHKWFSN